MSTAQLHAVIAFVAMLSPGVAQAATLVAAGETVDLTGIATAVIAGVFSVLAIVVPLLVNAHVQNAAAATALSLAVKNSLGAIEQASTAAVAAAHPVIPGVPAALVPGVQYVLDHAGDEAARLGITPVLVASKINAQIGLAKIAAGSSAIIPPAVLTIGGAAPAA